VSHRQTSGQASPPSTHPWLIPLIRILHPQRDETIKDPIPLGMQNPLVVLKTRSLDGGTPQEVLVVEVQHRVVDIPHPLTIQTINDGGVLGVFVNDVGARVRVPSLVNMRNRDLVDTIGIMGDSRHDGRR